MNPRLPIFKREGQSLELKSLAALAEPVQIARGAVAMLNAQGGEIWVGIKEGDNQNRVEPMLEAEAERARRRLQDHLLDVIEPTLISGEVLTTTEPIRSETEEPAGGRVLLVTLKPVANRRPYALLRQGGRQFPRRFEDRIVAMTRQEIADAMAANQAKSASTEKAHDGLQGEMNELVKQPKARFWIGLEPTDAGDLKIRAPRVHEFLEELLSDANLSGNPAGGFNFTAAGYRSAPKVAAVGGKTAMRMGDADLSLSIHRSGGVRFEAALEEIFWVGHVPFVGEKRLLSPDALLGYPLSVARLVGRLLGSSFVWSRSPTGDIWAALAITGLRGWGLLPGNLAEWPRHRYEIRRFQDKDLLGEPLRLAQDDLRERPDECGLRLVERVYDAFKIDLLPSESGALLGHARLPKVGPDGYSRWVKLDLGATQKVARLRTDNLRPTRFEWETEDGDLIPADGRWVHGWRSVE